MNPRALAKALAAARAVPFSGTAFRMVPAAFANPAQALSGVGAARRGGRWNPQGVRAVYLGEDAELLAREVGYTQSLGGVFRAKPKPPTVLYSVEFEMARVLRVDDAFVARIEAGWDDLLRDDWAIAIGGGRLTAAMQIGRAAYVAARLHHEVRYFEPLRLLRETFDVSEEETLERLAVLFGYEGPEALPSPKSRYDLDVDERIVAWYGLELVVFAFAHQAARLGFGHAYYVPDVNPFLMDLDRFERPQPGFVLPFPVGTTTRWEKKIDIPFARLTIGVDDTAVALGVWYIDCDGEVDWVFHGMSGDKVRSFERKVRAHHGLRIPFAGEEEMVRIAERACANRMT